MNNKSKAETVRSKYNVGKEKEKRTFEGIVFDSVVEMNFYKDVVLPLLGDKKIKFCERQKDYMLQPSFVRRGKKISPIMYRADFYIIDNDDKEIVIDIKGCPDAVAKLKRKMFWYVYPNIEYLWIGYSKIDGGWIIYEDLIKNRKERKKIREKKKEN